jgi:hypothetical protein
MTSSKGISRRRFVQSAALVAAGSACVRWPAAFADYTTSGPLQEFGYGDVSLASALHEKQLADTQALLMELSDDALLKPFRAMIGQPAPGEDLGGWYRYDPNYDWRTFDAGFAPSATFGQWVSAQARMYAINGSPEVREKVLRLNRLYAKTIVGEFYVNNRFPAYCYDKLVCGLMDSHRLVKDPDAYRILELTTNTALQHLPDGAVEHGKPWRPGNDESYTWDESYTNSENLFLAYQYGAGDRYRELGKKFLADFYYDPLAEGRNVLAGRHAYSHVNSLSSAMQAYMTLGSEKHLRAAKNAFEMLTAQSFATGGWGPDEQLRAPGSPDVEASLSNTHNTFETPCGAYAHFKLTRYLLRVTRESRYGDSMERVMYNTILGAKPMQRDGRSFYYSDYNFKGHKVYCDHRWPCCSGTMPQVAADYRINSYFRSPQGVYVNLYIPSTVKWTQDGAAVSLAQKGGYPFDPIVQFEVQTSRASEFAVNLRIPEWAKGASISVNGKRVAEPTVAGTFASVRRQWKNGDRVEVELPLTMRLEAIDAAHPKIVAVVQGPLVLFGIGDATPDVTGAQLLAAKKIGAQKWVAESASAKITLLPFTAIEDELYSTYVRVK